MNINQEYKALDLYNISVRDGKDKEYLAYTDSRQKYIIQAFTINTEGLKKKVLNTLLGFIKDSRLTEKILKSANHYIVGLFDLESKQLIDGTLVVGSNKTVLEDFQKKISSPKYKDYFKDTSFDMEDTFTINSSDESFDELDVTVRNKRKEKRDVNYKGLTISDLEDNLDNSRIFLSEIKEVPVTQRISKMGEIQAALDTYEKELKKTNVSDQVLDDILSLSFGGSLDIQEEAMRIKMGRSQTQKIARESRKEREQNLFEFGD